MSNSYLSDNIYIKEVRIISRVYIVLYNGEVSSEGYDSEEKAVKFIESRSGNPEKIYGLGWTWIDDENNEYKIKEANIR